MHINSLIERGEPKQVTRTRQPVTKIEAQEEPRELLRLPQTKEAYTLRKISSKNDCIALHDRSSVDLLYSIQSMLRDAASG
jgi:site-specific recombinase XerC